LCPIQFVSDTNCADTKNCADTICADTICSRYNLCRYNLYMNQINSWKENIDFLPVFGMRDILVRIRIRGSKIKGHKEVTKQEKWKFFLPVLLDDRRIRSRIRSRTNGSGRKHTDPEPDPQHCLLRQIIQACCSVKYLIKSSKYVLSAKSYHYFLLCFRVFFYNPTTKTSVWEKPAEMVGRNDVAKMLESSQVLYYQILRADPNPYIIWQCCEYGYGGIGIRHP
jgi:hypothetical protein